MKQVTILTILTVIAFTSCKKNWTCTCVKKGAIKGEVIQIEDKTRKRAKAACNTYDDIYIANNGACTLQKE